jgi:hypothetical protein
MKPLKVTAKDANVVKRGKEWFLLLEIQLPFGLRQKTAPKAMRVAARKAKAAKQSAVLPFFT